MKVQSDLCHIYAVKLCYNGFVKHGLRFVRTNFLIRQRTFALKPLSNRKIQLNSNVRWVASCDVNVLTTQLN
jgi:hypothetical protein